MNKRIVFKVQLLILVLCASANASGILNLIAESRVKSALCTVAMGVALPLVIGQARQSYVNKQCDEAKSKVGEDDFGKYQELVVTSMIEKDRVLNDMQTKLMKLKSNIDILTGVVADPYQANSGKLPEVKVGDNK